MSSTRGRSLLILLLAILLTVELPLGTAEADPAGAILVSGLVVEGPPSAVPHASQWPPSVLNVTVLSVSGDFTGVMITQQYLDGLSADEMAFLVGRSVAQSMESRRGTTYMLTPRLLLHPYDDEPDVVRLDWTSKDWPEGRVWAVASGGTVAIDFPRPATVRLTEFYLVQFGEQLNRTADRLSEIKRIESEQRRLGGEIGLQLSKKTAEGYRGELTELEKAVDELDVPRDQVFNGPSMEKEVLLPAAWAQAIADGDSRMMQTQTPVVVKLGERNTALLGRVDAAESRFSSSLAFWLAVLGLGLTAISTTVAAAFSYPRWRMDRDEQRLKAPRPHSESKAREDEK